MNTPAAPQVSKRPLIGIFGVLLGVNISIMSAQMMTIGLPDLRGVLGIGIDQAAWIPTAFTAAQMFVGPMSVALGALFGHRKVLTIACVISIIASLICPLVADYHWIVAVQIIRGLSAG